MKHFIKTQKSRLSYSFIEQKDNRRAERREIKKEKRDEKSRKGDDKVWVRAGKFNRHHIFNKCRGGTKAQSNMLRMDIERHNAWHFLFHNLSKREVAALLNRTCDMKGQQDPD